MGEFTNYKDQQTLHILRMIHVQVAAFAASQPEAALADFEQYIRLEMKDFEAETEANKRSAEDAVLTKPLTGPLANPNRQAAFRKRQADSPADESVRRTWWAERTAVLQEIKAQGIKEALDWDCRACRAGIGDACRTAGGRVRVPHSLRVTDAELPYHQAYGTRRPQRA
ncbi:hypothetical protein QC334_07550 [Streptomyces sp. DH18]|uniref:zinc finger domain-containing protein n=1 Tax=Streptomyces sp. DH18 TaxID=3040126 RepID=UPI0024414B3E|nr:hypothetical protein [Streptomyces sp. DH18]MDG9682597.1 hypothetical protein [Streptomyces sp. DH18]